MRDKVTIYVDMDGVLVDFVKAAHKLATICLPEVPRLSEWVDDGTDMAVFLGLTSDQFAEMICDAGYVFWERMQPLPWAVTLLDRLEAIPGVERAEVCTTPFSGCSYSESGKVAWLRRLYGHDFNKYTLTHRKQQMANPKALLLDDFSRNVKQFRTCGGMSVQVPTYYNELKALYAEDSVEDYILTRVCKRVLSAMEAT